jgi:hypothetical protein
MIYKSAKSLRWEFVHWLVTRSDVIAIKTTTYYHHYLWWYFLVQRFGRQHDVCPEIFLTVLNTKLAFVTNWPTHACITGRTKVISKFCSIHYNISSWTVINNTDGLSIYSSTVLLLDLGRGIGPSQGRYLHTEQHKHRLSGFEWVWNPRSQYSSGQKRFML